MLDTTQVWFCFVKKKKYLKKHTSSYHPVTQSIHKTNSPLCWTGAHCVSWPGRNILPGVLLRLESRWMSYKIIKGRSSQVSSPTRGNYVARPASYWACLLFTIFKKKKSSWVFKTKQTFMNLPWLYFENNIVVYPCIFFSQSTNFF